MKYKFARFLIYSGTFYSNLNFLFYLLCCFLFYSTLNNDDVIAPLLNAHSQLHRSQSFAKTVYG